MAFKFGEMSCFNQHNAVEFEYHFACTQPTAVEPRFAGHKSIHHLPLGMYRIYGSGSC